MKLEFFQASELISITESGVFDDMQPDEDSGMSDPEISAVLDSLTARVSAVEEREV